MNYFYVNLAPARAVKFAKENSLPATERQSPILDKDSLRRPDDRRLDMRVRIAFSVAIAIIARHHFVESSLDIASDIGIVVLVDDHARSGMRDVEMANPFVNTRSRNFMRDFLGDIDQFRAPRRIQLDRCLMALRARRLGLMRGGRHFGLN